MKGKRHELVESFSWGDNLPVVYFDQHLTGQSCSTWAPQQSTILGNKVLLDFFSKIYWDLIHISPFQCTTLIFSIFIDLCDHHNWIHFYQCEKKETTYPSAVTPNSIPTLPSATISVFSVSLDLPVLDLWWKWYHITFNFLRLTSFM